MVRLPVNKNVDVKAVYQDARWETFARLYNEQGRYVPQIPNWTPVRQVAADGFNRIFADCSSDIAAELKTIDGKVNAELKKQNVLAN
ncbi:extracellular solute-binding protein [Klebsiella oxytoca]|nr:extracellular solute-binding protein [Klebsiella oxytoca]